MEILYEDDDIIVVNKEAGLPVQAGTASQKDLISILKNHLCAEKGQALPGTEEPYLGIVHRLDQPVEGLVVFAKTPQAASELSRQVQAKTKREVNLQEQTNLNRERSRQLRKDAKSGRGQESPMKPDQEQSRQLRERVKSGRRLKTQAGENGGDPSGEGAYADMRKVYQAVVLLRDRASCEKVKRSEHSVTVLQNYLKRNFAGNTTQIVPGPARDAKWSELTFRTLKIWPSDTPWEGRALLEIHLHTGRHHQIRVQLAGAGLPIDGDRKYGPAGLFYDYNLKLCAASLQFRHPVTHQKMKFFITPSFLKED
jgi:23S rRNA pseudouridine1911/1915/1917 synthase